MCEEFKVGDFVYISKAHDIGRIRDITHPEGCSPVYHIAYCQGKDISKPTSGGSGSIFATGYPQAITDESPALDQLFVTGAKLTIEMKELKRTLQMRTQQLKSIETTIALLKPPPAETKNENVIIKDDINDVTKAMHKAVEQHRRTKAINQQAKAISP